MLMSLLANVSGWVQAGDRNQKCRSLTLKSINCDKRVTVTYGEALWSPRVEEDTWGRTDLGGDPFQGLGLDAFGEVVVQTPGGQRCLLVYLGWSWSAVTRQAGYHCLGCSRCWP